MTARIPIVIVVVVAALAQFATSSFLTPASQRWNGAPLFPKLLLWNASASAPRGLYLLQPARTLYLNELVTVSPPTALATFLAARGYLPADVPLLKHIAALSGQIICRTGYTITVDGRAVALARDQDHRGRLLPSWSGCRTLRAGEVFVLNTTVPDSFDGRYFGPLPRSAVAGRAVPVWTETSS